METLSGSSIALSLPQGTPAGSFALSDLIFATVMQHGRELLSLRLSGITSMTELLRRLRQALGSVRGLVTLRLRNSSQGWTAARSLRLA